ncbi:MAG: FAD-dependent monooxygenase, partial [Nocardioides sp.]
MTTVAALHPVVIVGAGPAGVIAATLLGQYGVGCLVLDRWDGVYPQPRAVHLDDEINRVLDRIGLAAKFAAVSRPAAGLRLVDRNHRVLGEFDRAGEMGRHGHPRA